MSTTSNKFGTGGDDKKHEGPSILRTFFNGMALAAGWMTVLGIIKLAKGRPDDGAATLNPPDEE